ncbi:MAG: 50S ribosomal protein L6 [Candidatus Marinimicrobia bacterium]|nr:50S ribosomal protein L6 [Candidatus Neomarinimicrobiota bacterium]MCF7851491.1 50S ribosomal protein L6 [Candidatus Neomarinimicrobiota bacterium]
MSRIGKTPVVIPDGVEIKISGNTIEAKGPKGNDQLDFMSLVKVEKVENEIIVTRGTDEKAARSAHGLTRALINNLVNGVATGYRRDLEVVGTGFTVTEEKGGLLLNVGFSHPVFVGPVDGITYAVEKGNTSFSVSGFNKYMVGQISAKIRSVRPPEPFKGKGIRYKDEYVRRKAGKTVGK